MRGMNSGITTLRKVARFMVPAWSKYADKDFHTAEHCIREQVNMYCAILVGANIWETASFLEEVGSRVKTWPITIH